MQRRGFLASLAVLPLAGVLPNEPEAIKPTVTRADPRRLEYLFNLRTQGKISETFLLNEVVGFERLKS